jgi:tRNA(fMet)-specific endonuclease VapC
VVALRYLLDTNAISEPVKPVPNQAFMARLSQSSPVCAIAAVTWHELLYGVARLPEGARKSALQRYLLEKVGPSLPVLPYDEAAAAWNAETRAHHEQLGRPLAFADGQIAAIARQNGLIVVTANVSDFRDLPGVVVENWLDEG